MKNETSKGNAGADKPKGKQGRKSQKERSHLTLQPLLNKAAKYLGGKTFGNKTAYIEHLILKDLEAQGLKIADIEKLAAEWEASQAEG